MRSVPAGSTGSRRDFPISGHLQKEPLDLTARFDWLCEIDISVHSGTMEFMTRHVKDVRLDFTVTQI